MAVKKIRRNEKLQLKGSLKKNGFDRWRLVTNAVSSVSGEEKTFFIEFYAVNPALSPKECVLGFKNRFNKSAEDFQYVLAGSETAKNFTSQVFVPPSFFMVKAGILSVSATHINSYFPSEILSQKKSEFIVCAPQEDLADCILSRDSTSGSIAMTDEELRQHPEYMGNAGTMSWNLNFTRSISFNSDYRAKDMNWTVLGGKTDFSGTITLNGEEFAVNPRNSFGYYDKIWGRDFSSPYFHLSSSNFISEISGGLLESSAFAVQGEHKGKVSVLVSIEGKNIEFYAGRMKKNQVSYDCQEMNGQEGQGLVLHWSVSVHNRKYVIDIDIFCGTKEMSLRDFESPAGGRKVMRILASGSGTGKFKLYKKMGKNLELLEQADISKCICEYGNLETAEK
ncbi:hypothetical protein [Treponema sp.]|uniref:hypothetical protein n=1 Tax=Treponema sp. TaxID=166 RepID=UPI003F0328D7